jgi:hypothetical protein
MILPVAAAARRAALHDGPAFWVGLAASPTFALMAGLSATVGADICSAAPLLPAVDGMVGMYLLMCLFHLPAWLRLAWTATTTPRSS